MKLHDFYKKKVMNEQITMVTCYDYTSARVLAKTDIDCILVGDSLAMTMHGFKDTVAATMTMMKLHTAAVRRGAENKFIISDMPFMSYRKSLFNSVNAAASIMQAGANALKLEGATGNHHLIRHLVDSGIPVMGHLGLMPQFVNALGGFTVQAKTAEAEEKLQSDAISLQNSGCFAIVLECVPQQVAEKITQHLTIPTIGVGAGPNTSGQALVWQDFLGLNSDFKPKFVKNFCQAHDVLTSGINEFIRSVKSKEFPAYEHCYR